MLATILKMANKALKTICNFLGSEIPCDACGGPINMSSMSCPDCKIRWKK